MGLSAGQPERGDARVTDIEDMIAAEACAYAARTPGAQVAIVGDMTVTTGSEPPGALEAFVAHVRGFDLDGPQPAAAS